MQGQLEGRRALTVLAGATALGVVLRLLVFRGSGFPSDVGTFMAWAQRMAAVGPSQFYAPGYFSDYPPGFLYVLWLIGGVFHDGEVLRLVVKALSIPADIAIAVVLFRLVRSSAGPMTGALAGALWMLQPAPIFAGPYWGQVDAWGTLPFLGALIAAGSGRWAWAGVLAAVAGMVKPQFGLVAVVVAGAAAIELVRYGRWMPLARTVVAGLATAVVIALPFGLTPGAFVELVRSASETYPYTSLFAFNVWAIVGDFWKPDAQFVAIGGAFLVAGILASVATLWSRRDVAMLLVAGALAAMAFYFLPTRAHERYLYPATALLVPFAVMRSRLLMPYVVLVVTFFVSLFFAFSRYEQNGLSVAPLVESTLFSRPGQIAIALVLMGSAAVLAWRLLRGEAILEPTAPLADIAPDLTPRGRWRLPPGLGRGRAPTRRDITVALLVALSIVATRGFRLDQPRDMYFDEVYHARTAFELLAQREPYEWTHPHLAKEVMALGILAFGGDDVASRDAAPAGATAFAVSNDGARAYGFADGRVTTTDRSGDVIRSAAVDGPVRALAFADGALYAATDGSVTQLPADGAGGPPLDVSRGAARFTDGPLTSFAFADGRAIVGTAQNVQILTMSQAAGPKTLPIPATAIAAKDRSNEVYVADPAGAVHVIDAATGTETAKMAGGGPVSALAWAAGPQRIYGARQGEAALVWYEPPSGQEGHRDGTFGGTVPLANGRTGDLRGPILAFAMAPRTQFLYALTADAELVVVETHGASPYAAIATQATMLGVDGAGDELLALGASQVDHVPTGRHAFAWRLPGVLFGAMLAFFAVLLARRLFASAAIPVIAGIVIVLDGSMFAQARIGMNDVYVGAFLVAGWYFVVAAHAPRRWRAFDLIVAGALFGLAAASKWAAIYALAGLGLYALVATARAWSEGEPGEGGPFDLLARGPGRWLAWRGGNAPFLVLCFLVIPAAIYVASYARWFGGPMTPFGWDLVDVTKQMYWYHSGLTAPHPAGSPWWSWPFVLKPVYWYLGDPGPGATAVIYDAGNVILFWGGLAALVWGIVASIRARSFGLGILVFALLTQYLAWVPISRVLFFYHFFTALPFYLLILAAALAALWEVGRRRAVAGYLALAAAAFAFFYPFVSGQPVPADQAAVFYVLPTWQYDCQFYPAFHCDAGIRGEIPFAVILARLGAALGIAALATGAWLVLRQRGNGRVRAFFQRSLPRRPSSL